MLNTNSLFKQQVICKNAAYYYYQEENIITWRLSHNCHLYEYNVGCDLKKLLSTASHSQPFFPLWSDLVNQLVISSKTIFVVTVTLDYVLKGPGLWS